MGKVEKKQISHPGDDSRGGREERARFIQEKEKRREQFSAKIPQRKKIV